MLTTIVLSMALALAAGNTARLKADLEKIAGAYAGDIGISVKNIETGETVEVNAQALYPMASTYKVAIMAEVFKQAEAGKFSLKDRVELTEQSRRTGSGLFAAFEPGLRPTIHDLILMMMAISDNTATDVLLDKVGAANVTATMRAAGLKSIRIDRPTRDIIAESRTAPASINEKDITTPTDMTELLAKIYKGEIVSKAAGEQMMQIFGRNQIQTRLQRYLPNGGRIVSKYGSIGGSLNDVGIMFVGQQHVAISVYLKNNRADRYMAEDVIGRIARTVYDYFLYTSS